jgi:hypothetical protein
MCDCNHHPGEHRDRGELAMPVLRPTIPVAGLIEPVGLTPYPDPPPGPLPEPPIPEIPGLPELPSIPEIPIFPKLQFCNLGFLDGCYSLTIRRTGSLWSQVGTVRVDRGAPDAGPDGLIVSGDVYNDPPPWFGELVTTLAESVVHLARPAPPDAPDAEDAPDATASIAARASLVEGVRFPWWRPRIPIYPRHRYHSYLKGTRLSAPTLTFGHGRCQVTLDFEQFDYTHPSAGSHQGSFPSSPSRNIRFVLDRVPSTLPTWWWGGPSFQGRLYESGVDKGSVTLTHVSSFLRRAVLEIDTLTGAVAPQPVPHPSGTGTQYFDSLYATAGWQLTVEQDQVNVPVPAGVTANACWSSPNLHNLMTTVRKATTDLDAEWRTHLVVVPAAMGCARGVMYDQIGVPREGSASFSDDGYPTSHSSNFGTAAGAMQRNVPRAFLRSAAHEVTHAFNQIHQENETAADNSIMTTTPSVADVLGGPATGAPGVFPDQISIGFNSTVRNHLAHMPDPVVRPGGWPFASWFGGASPQAADRAEFDPSELALAVEVTPNRAALGAPVRVAWTLTNTSGAELIVPNDVSLDGLFASITVVDDRGTVRPVRPFVIECEASRLTPLAPDGELSASHLIFWSSDGFALDRPGRHVVTVSISWSANGVPVGLDSSTDVWVDSPVSDAENADAATVLHPEVGKWVALGGEAYHLTEAVDRLSMLKGAREAADAGGSRLVEAFADLLPTRTDVGTAERVARRAPARTPATKATKKRSAAKKTPTAKRATARKAAKKRSR